MIDPDAPEAGPTQAEGQDPAEMQARFWADLLKAETSMHELQHKLRLVGSGWLAGLFVGIGWATTTGANLPIGREWIVALIGAGAAYGLYMLWALEMEYHLIMKSYFVTRMKIEAKNPATFPQATARLLELQESPLAGLPKFLLGKSRTRLGLKITSFYRLGVAMSLAAAGVGTAIALYDRPAIAVGVIAVFVLFMAAVLRHMTLSYSGHPKAEQVAEGP